MKPVFVISGTTNRGKSDTAIAVRDELIARFPDAKVEELVKSWGKDIKTLIAIRGIKIGIESQGDPTKEPRLLSSLAEFVRIGCEVIVCATRTRGKTREAVDQIAAGYTIVEHRHEDVGTSKGKQDARNEATAAEIVAEIAKLLS